VCGVRHRPPSDSSCSGLHHTHHISEQDAPDSDLQPHHCCRFLSEIAPDLARASLRAELVPSVSLMEAEYVAHHLSLGVSPQRPDASRATFIFPFAERAGVELGCVSDEGDTALLRDGLVVRCP
jgi:hypothetical protein